MDNSPDDTGQYRILSSETIVALQALEIARESEEGAQHKIVRGILEEAIDRIWGKVETQPDSYIMTRDEVAIFNYFHKRFVGNETAVAARKRYWDHINA